MVRRRRSVAPAALAVAALTAGCGGDEPARPVPTIETPAHIDVAAVNAARDAFVGACRTREQAGGAVAGTDDTLRQSARTLIEAFRANPDERFRRSAGTPPVSMRDRLRASALIARTQCGGGAAERIGDRLARVAARGV